MALNQDVKPVDVKLPLTIISRAEIARLLRELNRLDDFFVTSSHRPAGSPNGTPPRVTRVLEELARTNGINLLEAGDRKNLETGLSALQTTAPSITVSFAAEPSPKAFEEILKWFRQNIHPQMLIQVGLQPSIAAGCVVRTPNKVFDMSLSNRLRDQSDYLAKLIDGAVNA